MKAVFGILALFLVAANAGVIEEPVNYEGLINGLINEAKHAAIVSVHQLEQQVISIVLDPLYKIEEALNDIEARVIEGGVCIDNQIRYAETVASDMHTEMSRCGVVAAKETAQIATDVTSSAQQIVFGGYDCITTYKKCQGYTNETLKKICMTGFSAKTALYVVRARSSINTIKGAPARVPVVFADADTCTHNAADYALSEFQTIQKNMDSCVGIN